MACRAFQCPCPGRSADGGRHDARIESESESNRVAAHPRAAIAAAIAAAFASPPLLLLSSS